MTLRNGFVDTIGNTPLIRLRTLSEATGCEILGKAEFLNPGGSVKDRAALAIVQDAEQRGALRPGGVIVEGTAGNTGIGLALVANARGYRTVIVIPDTQSQEKKETLRISGAMAMNLPQYRKNNTYQFVDTVSYIPGNHAFKSGIDVRMIDVESFFFPTIRGRLSYPTLQRYVDDIGGS